MLVILARFFPLFDLNFLISFLVYVTLLSFILRTHPLPSRFHLILSDHIPPLPFPFRMFCLLRFHGCFVFFSLSLCSLSGVQSVFTVVRRTRPSSKSTQTSSWTLPRITRRVSILDFTKDRSGKKRCFFFFFFSATPENLPQVPTRRFFALWLPVKYFPLQMFLSQALRPYTDHSINTNLQSGVALQGFKYEGKFYSCTTILPFFSPLPLEDETSEQPIVLPSPAASS